MHLHMVDIRRVEYLLIPTLILQFMMSKQNLAISECVLLRAHLTDTLSCEQLLAISSFSVCSCDWQKLVKAGLGRTLL